MSKAPSRRLLGRYEIVAEIARGGMGTVFLARLEGVGGFRRLVAVKLMHRHLATEDQFVHMLLDEARLASQLHHPNAVGVIDVDEAPVGLYIVMEYVDGFAMDDVLAKLADVAPETRIRIGMRIWLDAVRGLAAAHRLRDDEGKSLGIVHRDVSPQNILAGLDGAGRITDFGIARAAARITSSHPGMIKGKPCYMAPEQARGSSELDARADLFALGIILWELLTGQMLFENDGGPAVTLVKVVTDEIAAPSSVAPEAAPLDAACLKSLQRPLEARFQNGRELYEEVQAAARDADLLATQDEVADFMREAFAEEVAARKTAIKEHLSAIGEASSKPMQESDIYQVPALKESARREESTSVERPGKSGPWHETPQPLEATADTVLADSVPPESGERLKAPLPRARFRRAALALAIVGLAMASAAAWMVWTDSQASAEARRLDERREIEERAALAEREAADLRAEAERAAATRDVERAEAERVEATRVETTRVEAARVEAQTARLAADSEIETRARPHTEGRPRMDAEHPTTPETSLRPASMQPSFENNPYLR